MHQRVYSGKRGDAPKRIRPRVNLLALPISPRVNSLMHGGPGQLPTRQQLCCLHEGRVISTGSTPASVQDSDIHSERQLYVRGTVHQRNGE